MELFVDRIEEEGGDPDDASSRSGSPSTPLDTLLERYGDTGDATPDSDDDSDNWYSYNLAVSQPDVMIDLPTEDRVGEVYRSDNYLTLNLATVAGRDGCVSGLMIKAKSRPITSTATARSRSGG